MSDPKAPEGENLLTDEDLSPEPPVEKPETPPGIGLDIGTMNLVSARRSKKGVVTKRMRDVFLDLPPNAKRMLRLSSTSFTEREDDVLILGDAAMETANVFGKEPRRPLSNGLISPQETDSLEVLALLVKEVLGKPRVKDEPCMFSIPAPPLDQDRDTVYHQRVFEGIVRKCGFAPEAGNEAMAIIFSECAKEGFSGIAFSFGSGMTNVALAINTISGLTFSVARGGDWIDQRAAASIGSTQARMCALKERGVDLTAPKNRDEQAIVFYYEELITYALDQVAERFKQIAGQFALTKEIPIVVSGGTSLAGGFMDLFNKVFEERRKKFPIDVSEVKQAGEPLNAVATGLLVQAIQIGQEE